MAPGYITDEETTLVKRYILLPMILTVFERDSKLIASAVKSPDIYTGIITQAADRVTKDLTEIRRQFRRRGIKVYEVERGPKDVTARFICRGYTGESGMMWEFLSAEAGKLMREYLSGQFLVKS
ncbi:hypothetical protein [Paenibacillus tuaregi]|uniref:hypothetical protein n=1 Tax=Paenibacillus tuaregi TaxID=1816681 RepID=UPI000839288A|nr:hypothetical protein [Paenibacillus tuaregi]